jgi:hypothetical protein
VIIVCVVDIILGAVGFGKATVLVAVFSFPGVAIFVVFAVVYDNPEAVGRATRFFLFVEEVPFLPEKDTRTEGWGRWASCAVAAFDVQTNTTAWLSLVKLLDPVQML